MASPGLIRLPRGHRSRTQKCFDFSRFLGKRHGSDRVLMPGGGFIGVAIMKSRDEASDG